MNTKANPVIQIQGVDFTLPQQLPYAEGHALTALEARVLNQTFAENIRNNFAARIKKELTADGHAENLKGDAIPETVLERLATAFHEFASNYTFSERQSAVAIDPVENEARKLARAAVKEHLRTEGYDLKDELVKAQLETIVSDVLESDHSFRKEALRRIDAQKKIASSSLAKLSALVAAGKQAPEETHQHNAG